MLQQLHERSLTISSDPQHITEAETMVEEIENEINLSEEQMGNIMLCVSEAVRNAMEHGNKNRAEKKVLIEVKRKDDALMIAVKDEGEGFDFEHLPDPTSPENLEKLTGRGVFLMRTLSDGVEYKDGGSRVEMKFNVA